VWLALCTCVGTGRIAESMWEGSSRSLRKRVAADGWGTVRVLPV
jgi:hypothetical protein